MTTILHPPTADRAKPPQRPATDGARADIGTTVPTPPEDLP